MSLKSFGLLLGCTLFRSSSQCFLASGPPGGPHYEPIVCFILCFVPKAARNQSQERKEPREEERSSLLRCSEEEKKREAERRHEYVSNRKRSILHKRSVWHSMWLSWLLCGSLPPNSNRRPCLRTSSLGHGGAVPRKAKERKEGRPERDVSLLLAQATCGSRTLASIH